VLKVLNSFASEANVWRAIEYGVDNGADVLTGSLGWPHALRPARRVWRMACENAIAAGVIVLFAAGNDACSGGFLNSLRTPADVPDVLAVGAVDCADHLASFSSCGPVTWAQIPPYFDYPYPPGLTKPDVSAPGVAVFSHRFCLGYQALSGTSAATPHVTGLVALMLEADPTLDPAEVRSILEQTAVDLGAPGKDNNFGWGRIDALAAVRLARLGSLARKR